MNAANCSAQYVVGFQLNYAGFANYRPIALLDGGTYPPPFLGVFALSGFTHESPTNASVEWYTPKPIFDALNLTFALDPCSPGAGLTHVPAARHLTKSDDGLTSDWGQGTVWLNPPYGREVGIWLQRLVAHGDGLALLFARTDVQWFHDYAVAADLMCFLPKRIKFLRGNLSTEGASPGAGSMLLAYGSNASDALQRSRLGACMTLAPQPTASVVRSSPTETRGISLLHPGRVRTLIQDDVDRAC